jgi:hypothetical protein
VSGRLLCIFAVVLASLLIAASAATAAISPLRHIFAAVLNEPEHMPQPGIDPRIHFETGAETCAAEVARLLPAAIVRVEAAQGRPFAHPVTIGVYSSSEAYARANATGTAKVAGTTVFGRVALSPNLCGSDRFRLEAILTHELSHGHLQGCLSPLAFFALPNWFKEGLAVYVAPGDGGSQVTADAAREAIAAGIQIAAPDSGSIFNLTSIQFERQSSTAKVRADLPSPGLGYREAALFVVYLHELNPNPSSRIGAILKRWWIINQLLRPKGLHYGGLFG